MDEKGDDGIGMDDDTPEQGTERTGTFGQDVNQSARQNGLKSERVADKPVQRVSLKERLAEMKIKATGNSMENLEIEIRGRRSFCNYAISFYSNMKYNISSRAIF